MNDEDRQFVISGSVLLRVLDTIQELPHKYAKILEPILTSLPELKEKTFKEAESFGEPQFEEKQVIEG